MPANEDQIFAALLGIPNVHVLSVDENGAGLSVVVETTIDAAACPSCGEPAAAADRRVVELDGARPFLGRALHLVWQTRSWSCENPDCPTGTFYEKADWPFSAA